MHVILFSWRSLQTFPCASYPTINILFYDIFDVCTSWEFKAWSWKISNVRFHRSRSEAKLKDFLYLFVSFARRGDPSCLISFLKILISDFKNFAITFYVRLNRYSYSGNNELCCLSKHLRGHLIAHNLLKAVYGRCS